MKFPTLTSTKQNFDIPAGWLGKPWFLENNNNNNNNLMFSLFKPNLVLEQAGKTQSEQLNKIVV